MKKKNFEINIVVFHLRPDHYMYILLYLYRLYYFKAICHYVITLIMHQLVLHFNLIIFFLQHPLKNCDMIEVDNIYECFMEHLNMEGTPG